MQYNTLTTIQRSVKWTDLVRLTPKQRFVELTISIPWLLASLILGHFGYYMIALPCSFMFFLTSLRQVHNGFHLSLGVSKKRTDWILWANSILMLGSMHAVKYNHLQHHKHCLDEHDVEGSSARMPGWKALLYGPIFPIKLHYHALRSGNRSIRRWVIIELISIFIFYSILLSLGPVVVLYHLIAMLIGECFTAFFAVWTVHHDCDEEIHSRTMRTWWKNFFTYSMFYHFEHHLFPRIPTINLPRLAKRIDKAAPDLKVKKVF